MTYSVSLRRDAIKSLEEINEPYYSKIKIALYDLTINPRPRGSFKLKGRDAYRIRVAYYRIIYVIIDNNLTIEIIGIGHRKDIYD
jgi:mRNA interferase RelE/StbE